MATVTNMANHFASAYGGGVDISTLDTSNVTNMSNMFSTLEYHNEYSYINDNAPIYQDLSNWDTGNVDDMSYMFAGVYNPFSGDLSNWDVSNVTNMSYMFQGTGRLLDSPFIDIANWDVSNVTDMSFMLPCHTSNINAPAVGSFHFFMSS